jgi:amphi-Trp domain-containing protein
VRASENALGSVVRSPVSWYSWRLVDALEQGEKFEIQIAGERVYVPVWAEFSLEHERKGDDEEIEFQIKWSNRS